MVTRSLVPIQITAVNDRDVTQVILTSDLIVFFLDSGCPSVLSTTFHGFHIFTELLLGGFNGTSGKPSAKSMSCQKRFHMGTDQWASLLTQSVLTAAQARHTVSMRLALTLLLSILIGRQLLILMLQVWTNFLPKYTHAVGAEPLADAEGDT